MTGRLPRLIPPHGHYARLAFDRLGLKQGDPQDLDKYTTWIMSEMIHGDMETECAQQLVRWARSQMGVPDDELST